jgi:hypothetical protein
MGRSSERPGKITSACAEQKVIREIMVFLHEHGAGTTRAVRISRTTTARTSTKGISASCKARTSTMGTDGELRRARRRLRLCGIRRFVPAYATTIHKSHGSEYLAVVIPVLTRHYAMLQRNLLYTGVTRGRGLVVLICQPRAVAIAVRNVSARRLWSKLNEWLPASRAMASTACSL